ncbi:uncharacterized protein A1O9_04003 [Exophiala aquamarina CBS 119918]|uniref:Xylanolytic transcriptional activator regulatory domain-containing protein n=1 Tax=Exophiala aquamarina CBS 119918 TaxID=1182545 RepID=A0A072PG87_9EURO|nr:uncharacterized protein A1O9_04003 [Exophiala aquamarina CBS 119918]KEF59159.1 hypothetical protein A1O9_04003 [Exophiala aquamarina CBS 119918]
MDQLLSPGAGLVLDMRGAEPPEALAWEYVNAFFDNCWEARLGFVSRSDFEAQLQAHFYNETPWCNDHATYALRNVVFAAGFRSLQAQSGTVSYTTAQKDAWQGCFSNALSVLAGLLLSPSQLSAVQALALMACYVESLGRPGFQRILCDNAVRAAVTQGLHREHKQLINTSLDESVKNAWLWWSLYVLEKHIAFVSGTPSVIDDSTITTPIPSEVSMDSNIDMQYLTLALRHTKICSRITRELMSTQARRLSVDALRKTVKEFDQQIKDFLRDLPSRFQIGTLAKLSTDGQRIPHPNQALYLHFSIYGSLLAVHSQFFYPWISSRLVDHDPENLIATQLKASSNIVAEAARKILVALRTLTTDAATPGWLAFSYPIYAHLSLLVYVLRNPTASTTRADLGLLDVCAGHFGYIDFITASAVSISLPRESVNLAAKVVKAAEKRQDEDRAADLDRITDSTRGYIPGKP